MIKAAKDRQEALKKMQEIKNEITKKHPELTLYIDILDNLEPEKMLKTIVNHIIYVSKYDITPLINDYIEQSKTLKTANFILFLGVIQTILNIAGWQTFK
ncbi:MAG: hypothetical protein A2888_03330 [Chlamydiae bacterium RIFCSPLOWO2_01_FULL_28_7]|nr:MAG: hypothetical protein A2888_03330 [Chlamydiae bacterium RIFCSPLOWO2_01_FULL_28_7]